MTSLKWIDDESSCKICRTNKYVGSTHMIQDKENIYQLNHSFKIDKNIIVMFMH
jgi:hypothetical protein